jgi:hypothetical protein
MLPKFTVIDDVVVEAPTLVRFKATASVIAVVEVSAAPSAKLVVKVPVGTLVTPIVVTPVGRLFSVSTPASAPTMLKVLTSEAPTPLKF